MGPFTKCEQSTDNQVSTEVEKCNSVVTSCNIEVETDNIQSVKQNTSDNVACNEVVMNDDLNTVNSKTCNTQNVVNKAFDVDNNNAFENQTDVLLKSHIDEMNASISKNCFVHLCNSETCAYKGMTTPTQRSNKSPNANNTSVVKKQRDVTAEKGNDEYVSKLVLNKNYHKHAECKSPCGICAHMKWKQVTEGNVQIPSKKVSTKRYGTSKVMVSRPMNTDSYKLDESERNLVTKVLSTAASNVSVTKNVRKRCIESEVGFQRNMIKKYKVNVGVHGT